MSEPLAESLSVLAVPLWRRLFYAAGMFFKSFKTSSGFHSFPR